MDIRSVATYLVPLGVLPALRKFRHVPRLYGRFPSLRPAWEYHPDGWKTADPRIKGWDVESVRETQVGKWADFSDLTLGTGPLGIGHESPSSLTNTDVQAHNTVMSFGHALALAAWGRTRISLLDWGGGLGYYSRFSRALLPQLAVDYHCRELPLVCESGRRLVPDVEFHDSDESGLARPYDIVVASSSLQYSEDWQSVVRSLAAVSCPYLFITRLPVVEHGPSFVVVQRPYHHGYLTEYLGWALNRDEFVAFVESLNLSLVREYVICGHPYVYGAPSQMEQRGYLFRR